MGIHDRDYYRDTLPRGGFGYFHAFSVTTWLIIINVVVFFLDGMLQRSHRAGRFGDEFGYFTAVSPLQQWGYFSTATAIYSGQVWRFLTFQFLHASPGHLAGNMIALYFFGPIVEAHFGSRRYLAFYLLCGLAGAASYLILSAIHVLEIDPTTPLVGASAGIFGLLVAAAMIAPHVQVFYYIFPMTVGMLAVGGMLLAAYTILALGPNAGGEAGHLGGGVLGFVLMKNQHWLNPFVSARRQVRAAPRRKRAFQKDWSKDLNR
jgi:membrane associated rhomboid family serine protease